MTDREAEWAAGHDALARMPGWAVGPCTYHGEVELWHVAAIDLRPRGRLAKREGAVRLSPGAPAAVYGQRGEVVG